MTGRAVQQLRRRMGLTQVQLAAKVGVHSLTISRWERGQVRITAPMAQLLRMLAASKGESRDDD